MAEVPNHFYTQSAVLPYRVLEGHVEIMLVTSRSKRRWVLPKGVVEPGLSAVDSAVKEAWEEAGVEGIVDPEVLDRYTYKKWGGICTVQVFPLRVERVAESWPESSRDRRWLELRDAALRVDEPELREIISKALPLLLSNQPN